MLLSVGRAPVLGTAAVLSIGVGVLLVGDGSRATSVVAGAVFGDSWKIFNSLPHKPVSVPLSGPLSGLLSDTLLPETSLPTGVLLAVGLSPALGTVVVVLLAGAGVCGSGGGN